MGPAGAGLVAKMINQLIVGCTHAVLAEALLLAEAAGIDAARIPECLAGGHADGTLLQKLYPRMVARDFAPQGYARQLLKDLEMVNEFAGGLKAPVPMTGEALSLYRMLIHRGHAELDTSAVFKLYERDAARARVSSLAATIARAPELQSGPIQRGSRTKEQGMRSCRRMLHRDGAGSPACSPSPAAHAQIKLRYAHVGVANAPQTLYADEVAKLVKERTNGRVEIQVFPNSQLGGVGEMVDGVKSGAISMGHHDFASLGKIVPTTAVFNTPFVYRDAAHSHARDRRAHVAGAAGDQPAAGRQGQHAHRRQLLPGHARAHVEGEGAVAEGHAGQEVPRRADQAVVVDADRHGRRGDAGRGVRARHGAGHRASSSARRTRCRTSTTSSSTRCRST